MVCTLPKVRRSTVLALTLAVSAAGCGGGGDSQADGPPPKLPPCAGAGTPIAAPRELPDNFPLPPGTVFRLEQRPFPGQVVLRGAAPLDLDGAASFFEGELEDAGYEVGRQDAEQGEREALFTGEGLRGGYRANSIPDCDAVQLTIVLIRQPGG